MQEVISINNVTKLYKVKNKSNKKFLRNIFSHCTYKTIVAVDNVTIDIYKGEFVGLVGNNGAGKSTLVKMLTGILYNSSGDIEVFGKNPYKKRLENNKKIGVVFGQRTQLRWDLSAIDSFRLLKAIYDIDDYIYNENIEKFIKLFKMESFMNQPVRTLSLGQKMKCEITAAFLHNPEIVFLDEPTIGLDIISKDAIIDFLQEIKKTKSVTILLTTHDMNEISQVCDRAVFLDKGKVILDENIKELMKINITKRDITIITENRVPIELEEDLGLNIKYKDHEIFIEQADKNMVFKAIAEIMKKNEIKDIKMAEESFTDIVRKIYGRE